MRVCYAIDKHFPLRVQYLMQKFSSAATHLRQIRSFVRREGRNTQAQSQAWEKLWPLYGLCMSPAGFLDLDTVFGRSAEKIIEIGFGDGHSLAQMARQAPEKDFIGIEVYRTGVASLLAQIQALQLSNIRIFCADAVEVLEQKIPDQSLMGVQLFFADPWPKTRHHKRRLVQPKFIDLIAQKLRKDGIAHFATDWMDYAYQMLSVLSATEAFGNLAGLGEYMPRPDFRPPTKYEQRALALGHKIWDLMFKRY